MPFPHGGRKVRRCRLGGWGCEIRRPRERLSSEGAGALAGRGACRSPRGGLMAPSGTSSSSWGRRRWGWGCSWLSARPPVPLARPGMPPPKRGLGQRLPWESRWEADAPSLSGKDGVWKSDEELRQWAGLLGEAWRPWLPRGHALCVVGARWAPGQAATSWRAFDDKVASSRVPRTHHHGSRRATCRVCIKPRYPALLHVPCPSKAEDLLRAAHFRKKALLGPLETRQRLATGQVSALESAWFKE